MKKEFMIFTLFTTALHYLIVFLFDKVWVKGAKRDVPKNSGVNNTLGEYLFYTLITTVISAVVSRQIGIWINGYMEQNGFVQTPETSDTNIIE